MQPDEKHLPNRCQGSALTGQKSLFLCTVLFVLIASLGMNVYYYTGVGQL